MPDKPVPADYAVMPLSKARLLDQMVKKNFMPAILSTVRQIIEDYGDLKGVCLDVGCGTAVFAIELCRRSDLKIYAVEKTKSICEIACANIKSEGLTNRIIPVIGDAHHLPFENEIADLVISRGSYHCWQAKVLVFQEIYRTLKKGGIGFVGGGFGRYVGKEESDRMRGLRDLSLKDDAKVYSQPNELEAIVRQAGILNFRIIFDESGLWAELRK